MQELVKLIMDSLKRENMRRKIEHKYTCKSEYWMLTEYDVRVLNYWNLANGIYIVKLKQDDDLECETQLKTPCWLTSASLF